MRQLVSAFAVGLLTLAVPPADGRDAKWIQQRLEQIKKSDSVAWKSIPWVATLAEARDLSAKEQRPVFLFTHDGNLDTGRC